MFQADVFVVPRLQLRDANSYTKAPFGVSIDGVGTQGMMDGFVLLSDVDRPVIGEAEAIADHVR